MELLAQNTTFFFADHNRLFAFIASAVDKIRVLRRMIDERGIDVDIEVDGGIKVDNIGAVAAAGANVFVSGSGVFGTKNYAQTIALLRSHAETARGG